MVIWKFEDKNSTGGMGGGCMSGGSAVLHVEIKLFKVSPLLTFSHVKPKTNKFNAEMTKKLGNCKAPKKISPLAGSN